MAKYKLGDICEIVSGSTPKSEVAEYWDGDIKWITPAELSEDSYIVSDSVRKITRLGVQKTGLTPFPAGTVILSSRAPIGKVAIAGCEMYCNQGFKNLICSSVIDSRYLYWFLKGKTAYLNSLGRGATFKEISKQIVASIEIEVPSLEQQIAIVQLLEKVNEIMKGRKQELRTLDILIKARFVELFLSEKKQYPRRSIKDVCSSIIAGGDKPKDTSEEKNADYPYAVYANAATNKGLLCYSRTYKVKEGSVTIAARGSTVGYTAVREGCYTPVVRLIAIIPGEEVLPVYLKYYLDLSSDLKSTGSAQPQITIPSIECLEISIPPLQIQKNFAAFVSHVDKSKAVVQAALDKAQMLFDSLMQECFG